ncbi:MAG: RNA methyltransferase [Candidatus Thermoplasmatota archaeon]|nr:RNA methyltransferase [Candidatus Thermoplasmatota archaeon]
MIKIILVEPKNQGNIGAIARVMDNFGFKSLAIVNPPELGDEAFRRAVHAKDTLEKAEIYGSFEDAVRGLSHVAGTSSDISETKKNPARNFMVLKEFAEKVKGFSGDVGIAFGREDFGLVNREVALCDSIIYIPTSKEYPSMNLSHACAIVLYELSAGYDLNIEARERASDFEREKFYETFASLLDLIDYKEHKKKKTDAMFKRLAGRAMLTKWEFYTFMGVIKDIEKKLDVENEK